MDKLLEYLMKDTFEIEDIYDNESLYYAFISIMGRYVVKDTTYRANLPTTIDDFERWFNERDEALAFLLLEHGLNRWKEEIKMKKDNNPETFWLEKLSKEEERNLPPYKYTQKKNSKSEGLFLNDGWGNEGINRFVDLLTVCENFRRTAKFNKFSNKIIESIRTPTTGLNRKKRLREEAAKEEWDNATKMKALFQKKAFQNTFDHSDFEKSCPIDLNYFSSGSVTDKVFDASGTVTDGMSGYTAL